MENEKKDSGAGVATGAEPKNGDAAPEIIIEDSYVKNSCHARCVRGFFKAFRSSPSPGDRSQDSRY